MLDTAVIPCGGLGTRLHPITRWLPKEMLPVALRPVLHWTLDEAAEAGLLRAIIITNPHKPMLEAVARSYPGPLDLEFVPQDRPARPGRRGAPRPRPAGRRAVRPPPPRQSLPRPQSHHRGPRDPSRYRSRHGAARRDLPRGSGQQGRHGARVGRARRRRHPARHRGRRQGQRPLRRRRCQCRDADRPDGVPRRRDGGVRRRGTGDPARRGAGRRAGDAAAGPARRAGRCRERRAILRCRRARGLSGRGRRPSRHGRERDLQSVHPGAHRPRLHQGWRTWTGWRPWWWRRLARSA